MKFINLSGEIINVVVILIKYNYYDKKEYIGLKSNIFFFIDFKYSYYDRILSFFI